MTRQRCVVITDGEERAALAVVRSLGSGGFRCLVTSRTGRSLAGASRHAERDAALPDALRDPAGFSDALAALAHEERPDLVIPITEPSLLAVLPARERYAPAIVPFPDADAFRNISDKALLLRTASGLGISIPGQHAITCREQARALDPAALRYPLVLKPARSIGEHGGAREKVGVVHVGSEAELARALSGLTPSAFPLLVQERVIGPGVGVFLLRWKGEIVASFQHRRLREKPPAGGVSTYREGSTDDVELGNRSRLLLEQFDWRGVAMIEYKRDRDTGTPYLMEINGRFWGSLQLAIDAGVDFPLLLARHALGEPSPRATSWRVGVRSRWWWGEVDHLLARLRRSRSELHLAPDAPSLGRTVADFILSPLRPGDRDEVFRFRDPLPFLRETRLWFHAR